VNIVTTKLQEKFVLNWLEILNSATGPSGRGGNKLRTYRLFKTEYETELYCTLIKYASLSLHCIYQVSLWCCTFTHRNWRLRRLRCIGTKTPVLYLLSTWYCIFTYRLR
jgi:hypothetical protein